MAGPLNRVPLGLLSFLELKAPSGRYPVQLADQILPQLDMEKFYRPQAHRAGLGLQAGGAIVGPNRFSVFTLGSATIVPQGELWFLAEYTVEITIQLDQAIKIAPALGIFIGAQAQVYRLGEYVTVGTGTASGTLSAIAIATSHFAMPRIIGPGMQLGFTVAGFTPGASLSASATCSFHRLVLTV